MSTRAPGRIVAPLQWFWSGDCLWVTCAEECICRGLHGATGSRLPRALAGIPPYPMQANWSCSRSMLLIAMSMKSSHERDGLALLHVPYDVAHDHVHNNRVCTVDSDSYVTTCTRHWTLPTALWGHSTMRNQRNMVVYIYDMCSLYSCSPTRVPVFDHARQRDVVLIGMLIEVTYTTYSDTVQNIATYIGALPTLSGRESV